MAFSRPIPPYVVGFFLPEKLGLWIGKSPPGVGFWLGATRAALAGGLDVGPDLN